MYFKSSIKVNNAVNTLPRFPPIILVMENSCLCFNTDSQKVRVQIGAIFQAVWPKCFPSRAVASTLYTYIRRNISLTARTSLRLCYLAPSCNYRIGKSSPWHTHIHTRIIQCVPRNPDKDTQRDTTVIVNCFLLSSRCW